MSATHDPFRYSALQGVGLSDGPEPSSRSPMSLVRYGRVLVVDDEVPIGSSLKRVFSRHHLVDTASSGAEALSLFKDGARFDVVLCDLMMPEMSGLDLHAEVALIAPDQAACFIFMSGASLTAHMSTLLANVPNTLVPKPFDMRRLTDLVRDRLSKVREG